MPTPIEFATLKLASSGLSIDDVDVTIHPPGETQALTGHAVASLRINYLDPRTMQSLCPRPKWPPFYRLRFLEPVFDARGQQLRYTQPPDSGVCAYFAPSLHWPDIIKNPDVALVITEGELKAAKACKEGIPTIGLGGVANIRDVKAARGFLPELEAIDWVKRRVTIVFDSDTAGNSNIVLALNTLAHELELRGALPYHLLLPALTPPAKTGLDDYLCIKTVDDLKELVLRSRQSLTLARPLWAMNERMVLVRNPLVVVDRKTHEIFSVANFRDGTHANHMVQELKVKDDGSVSIKAVPLAPAWVKWPLRNEVQRLTYQPGLIGQGDDVYSTWKGWGTQPVKGDVTPFLKLIDHLFTGYSKEEKEWFLRWLAYPIQHPGAKMYSAAILHGIHTGTGKSFVGYCMARIYGENFKEIQEKDLDASFTGWLKDRQFILGDDVTGSDKRSVADLLKRMITQKSMTINIKYLAEYTVPDTVNYLFTSNHPDAFFLDDTDRRFFVVEVKVSALPPSFYHGLEAWLASEAGGNALHHYLLHLPMGNFDHRDRALMTTSKRDMIDIGKSDMALWVDRLLADPDRILVMDRVSLHSDLFSSRELLALYDRSGHHKATPNAMSKCLKRALVPQVCEGAPVRWPGGQDRYWAIRNPEIWATAKTGPVRNHLEKTKVYK